jgi:lipopolysaccharide/colanic/teichoic acid biosynthesis glycosyltransferase
MNNCREILKTLFDYTATLFFLALLSPVILILTICIILSGKDPVIFSQKRVGKDGKLFSLYKFRSMYPDNEEGARLISGHDDTRITSFGRFMRKHKIDEIPNFLNVLKGEMSIIGPRPEQKFFIDQIVQKEPRYKKLLIVKPGITSWGQVKFGYASNVDDMIKRMEYDLEYIERRSFVFDMKIAFHTLALILKGQGI